MAPKYVELLLRDALPKTRGRLEKQSKVEQLRDKALTDAETKYRSLDTKQALTLALLELRRSRKDDKGYTHVPEDGILRYL
eukprot:8139603-Pyramimonas_sp.AAC.1